MDRFNVKPGKGRKVFAALIFATAISSVIIGPLSSRLFGAGMLIAAYDLAFVPSPPLNLRLSEIYAMSRKGWRMSWSTKILTAISWILLITAGYLKLRGR
jgi:hypothetical protein